MRKFSISRLEEARSNPRLFAQSLKKTSTDIFLGISKFMTWRNAIFDYHKEGDLDKIVTDFKNKFLLRFTDSIKNQRDLEEYIWHLHNYADECHRLNLIYIEQKKRIKIDVTDKLIISGEIPMISMNNNFGYTAFFLGKVSSTWDEELKFPIIQNYLATNVYGVNLSEIEVGIYGLDQGKLLLKTYSEDDVQDALEELQEIGNTITLLLEV